VRRDFVVRCNAGKAVPAKVSLFREYSHNRGHGETGRVANRGVAIN